MTQAQLAEKARSSQVVIARLESGTDGRVPSLELLERIAAALKAKLLVRFDIKKSHKSARATLASASCITETIEMAASFALCVIIGRHERRHVGYAFTTIGVLNFQNESPNHRARN